MAIVYSYNAFRHHFAEVARSGLVSLTYDHSVNPSTITRASGSFVADGFAAGHSLRVLGTTNNNAEYEIGAVTATTITLATGQQFNSSETIASSLVGAFYELDGKEKWPLANVRAGGFTGLSIPRPIITAPIDITCNAGATDIADGTTYTWYVSQRTPDANAWMWAVTQPDAAKSGSIRLSLTAYGLAELGAAAATALNADHQIRALRKVFVYAQRASDKAIQLAELYTASNALT